MMGFFLLAHWLACIWYVIAEKEMESHVVTSYRSVKLVKLSETTEEIL